MKKLATAVFTAIFATALFTGCGNTKAPVNYDLSDTELSHALGMSKKDADKLPYKSDSASNDSVCYFLVPHEGEPEKSDCITMMAEKGRIETVGLAIMTGKDSLSAYTVCGIRAGERTADALETAKSYFGNEGIRFAAPEGMENVLSESYIFGDVDSDKGELVITINSSGEKVLGLDLSKE